MIFLHKILPLFLMPIMVFILIILFNTFKGYKKLTYYSLILFYFISTPIFSNFIMKQVEGEYAYGKFENQNKADAIVVLSGMMRINEFENDYKIEWGDTDRFFKGIELYNFDKSNMIIFTGAKSAYNKTKISEGEILKEYAIKLKNYDFCGLKINVPKDFKSYLEDLYGKNWKIPHKNYNWIKHSPSTILLNKND